MTDVNDCPEFFELMEALCCDSITPEQRARLTGFLSSDQKFQRAYFQYLHMHVCLRRALGGAGAAERSSAPPVQADKPRGIPMLLPPAARTSHRFVFLAAGMAAALVALVVFLRHAAPPAAVSVPIATLTNEQGCVWDSDVSIQRGARLNPGRLILSSGVAQLTFSSGAVAVLEAPAEFELISAARAFLHSGRVVVRAENKSQGFIVDTARAEVLDLGTEFGVAVDPTGETLVQVYDGMIEAGLKAAHVTSRDKKRLLAGQAMEIEEGASRALAFSDDRFIRRLPDPPADKLSEQWLIPYNKDRVDSINVVRAPGRVTIDGNLSDWDVSGVFKSHCAEPYAANYNVKGYMMSDSHFLYIGAHVRDPSPMRSVIDPGTDPNVGWKGGSVQVRLSTDRSAGWPAGGDLFMKKGQTRTPKDVSNKLAHITMWYYRPTGQPCLHVEYGMDFHGMQMNPQGYQGAYTKDADGRGYTMEYAIPWSLLNAESDPPQAGDTLAACWNVHWSDEGGRLWKGYLVDVLNPKEEGYTHARAATWGKAIFRK